MSLKNESEVLNPLVCAFLSKECMGGGDVARTCGVYVPCALCKVTGVSEGGEASPMQRGDPF